MQMKMKRKKRKLRYDINRPRSRYGHKYSKYKKFLSMMIHICIKQHLATFEAQLTKMLSSTEDELNKSVAYKRTSNFIKTLHVKEIFLQNDFLHHNM